MTRPRRKEIDASHLMVLITKLVCGGIGARAPRATEADRGYIPVANVATGRLESTANIYM